MGKVCTFPKVLPTLTSVKQIALGEAHTLVLDTSGSVHTFGWNEFGQLGVPVNTATSFKVHTLKRLEPCG